MLQTRLAELRARKALDSAGLRADLPLTPLESVTNEVWGCGDYVLRVNRRLHSRLRREADLAPLLSDAVSYPKIVAVGKGQGADWVVVNRAPGMPLVRCWPLLTTDERRRAVDELAASLRALHDTEVPDELADSDDPPQLLQPGTHAAEPLFEGLERAAAFPFVDPGLLYEVGGFVRSRLSALDPFESTRLIHGDLHFQNVLWDGEHVTALLDLEFARAAPADLDLDVFLRFCSYPALFVPEGREAEARREDYDDVPFWLQEAYPELFAHPRVIDRVRIYAVAFDLKALLLSPPRGPLSSLTMRHPYRRLLATVRQESHLDRLRTG